MTLSGIERAVFVHGFLGLAEDWNGFARSGVDVCVDLWSLAGKNGEPFGVANARILAEAGGNGAVLIGYSMGARLAMHALIADPGRYRAAILISGNPGLTSQEERVRRLEADQEWARRFRKEPWDGLMKAWNNQAVLAGGADPGRKECDFNRDALAWALEHWSLGRQRDLRAELAALDMPILYLTGAEDKKFTDLVRELVKGCRHRHIAIEGAGHRLPWEKASEFVESVTRFVQTAWTLA